MAFDYTKLSPEERASLVGVLNNPLLFAETFCKIPSGPEQGEPFQANYPQTRLLEDRGMINYILFHRRSGKCAGENSLVLCPDTLRPIKLKDVKNKTKTLVFDFEENTVVWSKAKKIDSGIKECVKLTTDTGNELILTPEHPLFDAKRAWVPVSILSMGDRILAPSKISIFGKLNIVDEGLKLLLTEFETTGEFSNEVFKLTKKCLRKFIKAFWEEYGRVFDKFGTIIFTFFSRHLCLELKHLLLRFEIESRVNSDNNLEIDDPIDLSTFFHLVDIPYPKYEIRSSRRWETITSIRRIGMWQTYDLEVENPEHNFLANDIVIHNSFITTFLANYHAVTENDKKIIIFAPAKPQLDAFFDTLDSWIDKNEIFASFADKDAEWRNNPYPVRSFKTGSKIYGYITGMNDGTQEAKRGLTPDVVICFPYNQKVLTDLGYLPIGDVVEKQQGNSVLTLNEKTNTLEWQKIKRRIANPLLNKKLLKIKFSSGEVICTEDHPILTNEGYKSAKSLTTLDIIYHESKFKINSERDSNFIRSSNGRRLLFNACKRLQKCTSLFSTRTKTRKLYPVEILQIEEVVQQSSKRSGKQRLWQNIIRLSNTVSSRVYKIKETILSRREESYNSRNFKSPRLASLSNLVYGRWLSKQLCFTFTHRGFSFRRSNFNSRSFNKFSKGPCCSKKSKNTLCYRSTKTSPIEFNQRYSKILLRFNDLQNYKFYNISRKNLHLLQQYLYSWFSMVEDSNILWRLSKSSPQIVQEELVKTEEIKVYDLEIENNHNFFVGGILCHNCDEAQELSEKDWAVVQPMYVGDQRRDKKTGERKGRRGKVRTYIAGTIKNPVGFFYEKTNGVQPLSPIERLFRVPITENPDYTIEDIEEIKPTVSQTSWVTEYLLQYGDTSSSVFKASDIERACDEEYSYGVEHINYAHLRFIGVDFDTGSERNKNGTNIAIIQYDPSTLTMKTINRVEIPQGEFILTEATNTILDFAYSYGPIERIVVDKGHGGVGVVENLKLGAIERNMSELVNKTECLPFNKNMSVLLINNTERENVFCKEFLVGQIQKKIQEGQFIFSGLDREFREQLISYKVVGEHARGLKYSSNKEHIIDCHLFAMYGIWYSYEENAIHEFTNKNMDNNNYTQVGVEYTKLPHEMGIYQDSDNAFGTMPYVNRRQDGGAFTDRNMGRNFRSGDF